MNSIQDKLNSLMPAIFDTSSEAYKLLISDSENNGGAIAQALVDLMEFRDYYTKTTNVDEANDILLDKIVSRFSGLTRNYAEPDDYFRLRYKALVERCGFGSWTVAEALRKSYSYFFKDEDIFIIESHPTTNLLLNGSFDTLAGWVSSGNAEAKIIYSKSFEKGSALQVKPNTAADTGTVYQDVVSGGGWYSLVFFFSSTKKGAGIVDLNIRHLGNGNYWNPTTKAWSSLKVTPRYTVSDATAGKYTLVQLFLPVNAGTVRVSFSTAAIAGFLLDAVAFGPVEYPNVRAMLISDPEVFYDSSILHDNTISHNGFLQYYILDGLEAIMEKTRAAGVRGETYLLSSRLSIPWDRVTIQLSSAIDMTPFKHDSQARFNSRYAYGVKDTRTRHFVRRFNEWSEFSILHDSKVQYNSQFTHSGKNRGAEIGLSRLRASEYVTVITVNHAQYNSAKLHNESILHDGAYSVSSRQLTQYYL